MLAGKNILLGITGSIAAYKSAFLTRLFVKAGANVKIVMTPAAKEFITPLTLSTLSKNPVYSEFTSGTQGEWTNHVELALWADIILIAPATADVIAKIANGICDNLLLAVYLSAKNKVFVAPAMDLDMFQHPSTKANLKKLESFGNGIISPGNGELASGLVGEGRMAEPEEIVQFLSDFIKKKSPLSGKKALVTAGPTYEAIDPVRFIGNNSSGKMGFALAEELASQGAEVTLVCGPNSLALKNTSVKRIDIISADDMYQQCMKYSKHSDITVMAAAVADFKPIAQAKEKLKKETSLESVQLIPTKDILSELGKRKNGSMLVGFALETENELVNAKKKLHNKNLDLIVLNSLKDTGSGFGYDTNKITIIDKKNTKKLELMSKKDAAKNIVSEIINRLNKK
jgi:phosphopantothenoylcysteine decarboxylase/phosphopantothenate--cysteine ligase